MIYENYKQRLKNIVVKSDLRKSLLKSQGDLSMSDIDNLTKQRIETIHEQRKFAANIQLKGQPLNGIWHPEALRNAKVGMHPDFQHLKGTDQTEKHYIVSIFIDIKGSTNLFKKYELEENYTITNTIQSAAIHTLVALGGHVQRLQGDGVFAYFGGKGQSHNDAVKMAVIACSMFTYFIQNDLKEVFTEGGIEDISTRIGIDFGYDHQVFWATFGLQDVVELTTLSLHTSLASKMQSHAQKNGINVGQHIKDILKGDQAWYSIISEEERYIFKDYERKFWYTQYCFDWFKFLLSQSFIKSDSDGKLFFAESSQDQPIVGLPKKDMSVLAMLAKGNKPYSW